MSQNPYESSQGPQGDWNTNDGITPSSVELRRAILSLAYWQFCLATLGLIGFAVTLLAVFVQMLFSVGQSQGGVEYAIYTMVLLLVIGAWLLPSIALIAASNKLRQWENSRTTAEHAIRSQRGFWRIACILMLIYVSIYLFVVLNLFGVAVSPFA